MGKIMETTTSHEAGLMAAWRATGGACGAMRGAAGRDEGMAAFGISRSVLYCADEGLQAMTPTDFNVCYVDDGLGAMAYSRGRYCADDGLAATMHSNGHRCWADDGLTATAFSGRPYGCADDGLQASMYSIGGGQANCPHADDGLAASAGTFRPPYCIAD
jgi:hypothetical protein